MSMRKFFIKLQKQRVANIIMRQQMMRFLICTMRLVLPEQKKSIWPISMKTVCRIFLKLSECNCRMVLLFVLIQVSLIQMVMGYWMEKKSLFITMNQLELLFLQ